MGTEAMPSGGGTSLGTEETPKGKHSASPVARTHGTSSASLSSASGQPVANRGASTMLEAPSGSGSRNSEGPSEGGTPPEGGDGGGDEEPPPPTPGKNGTSSSAYRKFTNCQIPTSRYHDVCGMPYCRKCFKGHKKGCKPKFRCSMISCERDGDKCDGCGAPFCEGHLEHDCGPTSATGTEVESRVGKLPGKGNSPDQEEDDDEDDDELRAAGEEAQRERDLGEVKRALGKGAQKGKDKGNPKGGRIRFEDDGLQQAPDRSDSTPAGFPAVQRASLEFAETMERREQNLLPRRAVKGWLGDDGMIPMAEEGADVSSWSHPRRLNAESDWLEEKQQVALINPWKKGSTVSNFVENGRSSARSSLPEDQLFLGSDPWDGVQFPGRPAVAQGSWDAFRAGEAQYPSQRRRLGPVAYHPSDRDPLDPMYHQKKKGMGQVEVVPLAEEMMVQAMETMALVATGAMTVAGGGTDALVDLEDPVAEVIRAVDRTAHQRQIGTKTTMIELQ